MRHNIIPTMLLIILASSCADPGSTSESSTTPKTIITPEPIVNTIIDSTVVDSTTVTEMPKKEAPKTVPTLVQTPPKVTNPIVQNTPVKVENPVVQLKPAQPLVDNTVASINSTNHTTASTSTNYNHSSQSSSSTTITTSPPKSNIVTTPPPVYSRKGPKATFSTTTHSYGQIKEGTTVDKTYYFTNTGDEPLEILNVGVTCGCTVPTYSFMPILPGATSKIDVHFESKGKMAAQKATITVLTNAKTDATQKLYLEGYVMPIWKDKKKDSTKTATPKDPATPPTATTPPANTPPKPGGAPTTTTQPKAPKTSTTTAPSNNTNSTTPDTSGTSSTGN